MTFAAFLGLGFALPFLPLFVQELGVHDTADAAQWAGVLIGVGPLLAGLLAPFWGGQADRHGYKRVALVAERNTPVRLKFSNGQVDIEAGTGDDAQASEAVEASVDGPEIDIAFNPGFLLDGLGALHTPYARLSFTAALKPAMITGQAEPDGSPELNYRYVLQPVRLTG